METAEWEVEDAPTYDFELEYHDAISWGASEYIQTVSSDAPEYDGPHEVTPTAQEQTLATTNRLLRRDLTVHKVPYFETSNESGGVTVSILS